MALETVPLTDTADELGAGADEHDEHDGPIAGGRGVRARCADGPLEEARREGSARGDGAWEGEETWEEEEEEEAWEAEEAWEDAADAERACGAKTRGYGPPSGVASLLAQWERQGQP
jgi:hypothetical protein